MMIERKHHRKGASAYNLTEKTHTIIISTINSHAYHDCIDIIFYERIAYTMFVVLVCFLSPETTFLCSQLVQ